ncbi:hypothetical protein [Maricaulis sp.]|uniref:hypothetical protein n=1 Tax=Maricaulis sp. TaxID=1486257 RepID=UPI001B197525|nr:hypothetical protein [Maricaulis sp.]MBO6764380.1 hypothetical protein [Maricaulis sp.]
MVEIFHSYWWLLFPLGFFLAAGWGSFMRYKRTQAKIDLIKSFTAAGKEPPAELLASLDNDNTHRHEYHTSGEESSGSPGGGHVFLVVLFTGLAGVFAYTGYAGLLGGTTREMYFISMVLGVLAVAFLFSGLFSRRRRND